jgi:hypothetical protein
MIREPECDGKMFPPVVEMAHSRPVVAGGKTCPKPRNPKIC